MYEERFYRDWVQADELCRFTVCIGESDLFITSDREQPQEAQRLLAAARSAIESYIARDRIFLTTLIPHEVPLDAAAIVRSIIAMAHAVDLTVVATEGVETEQQLEVPQMLSCDQAQGYDFGRPGPPDEVFAAPCQV